MTLHTLALTIALFSVAVPINGAETPAVLIDGAALEARLQSEKLALLDARSEKDYLKAHIPGAVRVDVARWTARAHSDGGFENAKAWADSVGQLGIDGAKPVVVYGSSPTSAARVWWTLKYLGVKQVLFLDGGWKVWSAEKRPTEAEAREVKPVKFVPKFQKDRLATIDEIKQSIKDKSLVIVDTRSDAEFTRKFAPGSRAGHIPGAIHLEWKRLMASDGRFKKPAEIRKLLSTCGISRGKPLVPY